MLLANQYVDDVIIGAPYFVTSDLIKSFNISKVVQIDQILQEQRAFQQQQLGELAERDPYQIPKDLGIFKNIKIDNILSTDIICQRIIQNRERQLQRFNKGSKKMDVYYNELKEYVPEL